MTDGAFHTYGGQAEGTYRPQRVIVVPMRPYSSMRRDVFLSGYRVVIIRWIMRRRMKGRLRVRTDMRGKRAE